MPATINNRATLRAKFFVVTLIVEPQIARANLTDLRASVLPDFINPEGPAYMEPFPAPFEGISWKIATRPQGLRWRFPE
jgi:hypothetical protein